jgi:glycosyltransferase 2 family protein
MNRFNTKKIARILAGFAVSTFFLLFIFRKIEVSKMLEAFQSVRVSFLIPAIVVYIFGVWVRTTRWCILMKPLKRTTTKRLFPVYMISYMVNNILPLRAGDVYRAYIGGRKENVSKSATMVTIGVERIFDGLTMLLLLILSILYIPIDNEFVGQAVYWGSSLFLGAIMICYILVLRKSWAEWLFNKVLHLTKLTGNQKVKDVFQNLFTGLDSLKSMTDILLIIVLSLATWIIEAYSYYLVLNAFGFYGTFIVAIATMALVNLMIVVPSAPGYFGPFEMACFIILGRTGYGEITGFTEHIAAAYALIVHVIVQWLPSTILGLIFLWKEHVKLKDIGKSQNGLAREAGTMKSKTAYILMIMVLLTIGFTAADDASNTKNSMKVVWFDGTGAYHYSDPLPYMNNVLQGKVTDTELRSVLSDVCKDADKITKEHLVLIADALDPLGHTFALYYPNDELIARNREKIIEHFNRESEVSTQVNIRSFSFQSQGDVSMILPGSGQSKLIALPADPERLTIATNQIVNDQLVMDKVLTESAKSPEWKHLAQIIQPSPDGNTLLFNLRPGPWIIYIDQKGLFTQCYRIILKPGQANELIADKTSAPPRKALKLRNKTEE